MEAAEALASSSQEIQEFVVLMQRMAKQSKLLAFSAGVETRRAGQEAAGFVVVAQENQRLADGTAESAERTEKVVTKLLRDVEAARASAARSASAVAGVRDATQRARTSFSQVEEAVGNTEAWTGTIELAARATNDVVASAKQRLETLARGTQVFAEAMEQVAASAEEQSAATEEVVGTATLLSNTAERLAAQAARFKLGS
jgi:methyl-accepting chemotaxis protein